MTPALSEIDLLEGIGSLAKVEWVILDAAHNLIVDTSSPFGLMLGVRSVQSYERLLSLVHEDDRDYITAELTQSIALNRSYTFEYRLAADATRWIAQKGCFLSSHWLIVLSDVTDRRTVQDAALDRVAHWRTLVQYSSDLILKIGCDYKISYATPSSRKILGHHDSRLLDTSLLNYVCEEDRAKLSEGIQQWFSEIDCCIEFRAIRGDGISVYLAATGNLLPGDDLLSRNVVVSIRDISQKREAEIKVRQQKEQLDAVVRNLPGIVFRCRNDEFWTMNYISDRCLDMTGYTAAEFLSGGCSFEDLILPKFRQSARAVVDQALMDHLPYTLEYPIQHRDGSIRWVMENAQGIFDPGGQVQWLTGVTLDVTESHQAKVALAISNDRISRIFRYSPMGICLARANDHCVIEANPALLRMLGYTLEELLQNNFLDVTHPDDRAADLEQFERCCAGEIDWYPIEKRYLHKNGTPVWVRIIINVIRDEAGQPLYSLGLVEDISDRYQMRCDLHTAQRELEFHFENTPLAVVKWDADFRTITHWSARAEEMFGLSAAEVLGRRSDEWQFIVEADKLHVNAVTEQLQSGALQRNRSCNRNYTKAGEIRDCEWYNSALWDEETGQLKSVLSLVLDVSDRARAAEAMVQAKDLRDAILAATADGILTITSDGKIEHYNQRFLDTWQVPPSVLAAADDRVLVDFQMTQLDQPHEFQAQVQFELEHPHLPAHGIYKLKSGVFLERYSTPQSANQIRVISYRNITKLKQAEEDLAAQVKQWRTLVENVPGAVFRYLLNENWTVQFVSDGIESITGYCASDYVNNCRRNFVIDDHPEDEPKLRAVVNEAIATRQPYTIEYRIIHRDGSIRWVGERGRVVFEQDEVSYIDGVLYDITERKLAEAALQDSECRYRAIVENQTEMVCRFLPDRTILFANSAYQRYFSDFYLVGKKIDRFISPFSLQDLLLHLKSFTEGCPVQTIEELVILPSGEQRWCSWVDRAFFDEQGQAIEFQSVGRDITERKLAETALRQSESQFRLLFEQSPIAIAMLDIHSRRLLGANQAFCDLLGHCLQDVVGLSLDSFSPMEDVQANHHLLEQAIEKGDDRYQLVKNYRTTSGEPLVCQLTAVIVRAEDGQALYSLGIIQPYFEAE